MAARTQCLAALAVAAVLAEVVRAQTALGTALTYQGNLKNGGAPANGLHDMQFQLFTALSGGSPVGSTICRDGVNVVDGLFTVSLDFGAAYDGNQRFLAIGVRPDSTAGNCGSGAYTALSPRQALTAAPYALKVPGIDGHSLDAVDGSPIDAVFVGATGQVGVGTTAPSATLHAFGNLASLRLQDNDSATSSFFIEDTSPGQVRAYKSTIAGQALIDINPMPLDGVGAANVRFFRETSTTGHRGVILHSGNNTNSTSAVLGVGGNPSVFQLDGGNFGIGAPTPARPLHVLHETPVLILQDSGSTSTQVGYLGFWNGASAETAWVGFGSSSSADFGIVNARPGGDILLSPDSAGFVGIGTQTPLAGLHVKKEPGQGTLILEGTTHTYISFFPDGAAAGRKGYMGFPGPTNNDIMIENEISGADIVLATSGGGATRVNVLEITGADLAEKFPASEKLEPGMVVAIDPDSVGQLCLARGAYNRRVAGIVSGANDFKVGAVLGNLPGHEDAPAIALSGRVYVHCDASQAAIEAGDLLTSSDTPGHAMKATDRERSHGAVIGKAMTRLAKGERGMVLVLVRPQ